MRKIQSLILNKLQPNLTVRNWQGGEFPKFGIPDVPIWNADGTTSSRSAEVFPGYYFVPKFSSDLGTKSKIEFLISFDSHGSNRIVDWTLSFGDGNSIEGKSLENLTLVEDLTTSSTSIKGRLEKNSNVENIPSSGILLIDNEYIKYKGIESNFMSDRFRYVNAWSENQKYGADVITENIELPSPNQEAPDEIELPIGNIDVFPDPPFTVLIDKEAFYVTRHEFISGDENPSAVGYAKATPTKTVITQTVSEEDQFITVQSTNGFPESGTLLIENEQIRYSEKTSVTFSGITRGANETEISEHIFDSNERELAPEVFCLTLRNVLVAPPNERQIIEFSDVPTGGTFKLSLDGSNSITNSIDYDATANDIQTELESFSDIKSGNVLVVKISDTQFVIEFVNKLASSSMPMISVNDDQLVDASAKVYRAVKGRSDLGEFQINDFIVGNYKDKTLGSENLFDDDTQLVAVETVNYTAGKILQTNSKTVIGYDTDFDADMVGSVLQYPDGSSAIVKSVSNSHSLTVDKKKTIGSYTPLSASASGKQYTYSIGEHDLHPGDLVTISGISNGNISGITVSTYAGTTQSNSSKYKKALLTVKKASDFKKLSKNVKYNISSSNIPAASGITFEITNTFPKNDTDKTFEITLSGVTGIPSGDVNKKVAKINLNGTCYYNINDAKITSVTRTAFTISGTKSDPGKADVTSGLIRSPRPYIVGVTEFTISHPVSTIDNTTDVFIYTPGPDINKMIARPGSQKTERDFHREGSLVRQLSVYKNKPYVCNVCHSNDMGIKKPDDNSKYWLEVDPTDLIITFNNLNRGVYTVTDKNSVVDPTTQNHSHVAGVQIKGVIKTSHYYKYDGGNVNGNGSMSVVLSGFDNHNRKFNYNTMVYPASQSTAFNWSSLLA